jgi:2-dehydropantoate 2-reductase
MTDDYPDEVYDHTVAVVGPGAVGLAIAGLFREAGHDVVLCGRPGGRPPGDEIVVTDGDEVHTHTVDWAEKPDDVAGVARCVVIATKIQDTAAAWPWLDALAGHDTFVLVAQNGVEHHDRIPPGVWQTVVPALVYINAEREAPGRVRLRRTRYDLVLPADPAGIVAGDLFLGSTARIKLENDFRTAQWLKLLTNIGANPITALTGRRIEVLHEPEVARLALAALEETATVGRAEGADLPETAAADALRWLQELTAGSTSSMLQDREAGRSLEADGLTGAVVRLAERHGIAVPVIRTLHTVSAAV